MSSDRFHRAARDGLLDVVKEATRKDANSKDDDSMTPVLWAAFEGRLDALRLLCGRGGDPDKCDQFGNTALHLASAKGHLHCVDFLVKFGVNIYALDIDKHSAKDLAAINNRDDILRYLDTATANFEATDRKKAKALKELAEKNCEKRMREYMKRQQKLETESAQAKASTMANGGKSGKMLSSIKQKIWSSQGNLHKTSKDCSSKYSDLVGGTANGGSSSGGGSIASRAGSGAAEKKLKNQYLSGNEGKSAEGEFKIGEIEADGKRTVTSLTGLQRDSEVLYVGTYSSNEDNNKRGKISDVFEVEDTSDTDREPAGVNRSTLLRTFSQPDFMHDSYSARGGREGRVEMIIQRPTGIFDRPILGSLAFRRSVTAALSQLQPDICSVDANSTTTTTTRNSSNNTKTRSGKPRTYMNISDSDSDGLDDYSDDDEDVAGNPIQRFLTVWGLEEYLSVFEKQQIDLDTLMLLTETDLKSLGLPLGPFRKLTFAIQERRNALANPGAIHDSRL